MTDPAKLKIFHINMHHKWGGQPNRILTESRGLAEMGHEIWIAGPRGCVLCERAAAAGLHTFDDLELRRGFRPASFMRDVRNLKALFIRERFDVIHPHGSQDTWASVFAARGLKAAGATGPAGAGGTTAGTSGIRPAMVRTRHNTFPIATHPPNRWLYRHIDWVVTIAPQVDELVSRNGLFPPDRIGAIYSVPDMTRFAPREPSAELRRELGIPEGAPVVGMVGRLAPEKGHHLLIGAIKKIAPEFPDVRVVLAGEGRSRGEIESRIAAAGLTENFILTGFREDVPDIVALFDVFALTPTAGESLGTSILEAFCMGKPAVATQVGGTGESVRTGKTGYLVPPGSEAEQIDGIAEGIGSLLRDAEARGRMGRAARELIHAEFSQDSLARNSEQLYLKLREEMRAESGQSKDSTP